jgi:hypothetical protein
MFASNGAFVTAGSRLMIYGGLGKGFGGLEVDVEADWVAAEGLARVWTCELSLCTNVVLPDPAIPIVMITVGFFFEVEAWVDDDDADAMVDGRGDEEAMSISAEASSTMANHGILLAPRQDAQKTATTRDQHLFFSPSIINCIRQSVCRNSSSPKNIISYSRRPVHP